MNPSDPGTLAIVSAIAAAVAAVATKLLDVFIASRSNTTSMETAWREDSSRMRDELRREVDRLTERLKKIEDENGTLRCQWAIEVKQRTDLQTRFEEMENNYQERIADLEARVASLQKERDELAAEIKALRANTQTNIQTNTQPKGSET